MSLPNNKPGSPFSSYDDDSSDNDWDSDEEQEPTVTTPQEAAPVQVRPHSPFRSTEQDSDVNFGDDIDEDKEGEEFNEDFNDFPHTAPAISPTPGAYTNDAPKYGEYGIRENPATTPDTEVPLFMNEGVTLSSESELSPHIQAAAELLMQVIQSDDSTEVIMNGPNEIMLKRDGARFHLPEIAFEDGKTYHKVINEYILPYTDTEDRIGPQKYLIEGQLELPIDDDPHGNNNPMIARVTIVAPPVVRFAKVTIAKKSRTALSLDAMCKSGSMTRGMAEFLKALSVGRACVVFSGLSGAGKTTMLEAMSHYFDQNDRVVVVEDTPELRLPIADTVYMSASSQRPGVKVDNAVTLEWLVKVTNRMRADRIIVGEIRGPEMSEFLVAANSGADGSMMTMHAGDPRRCLDKMLGYSISENSKNEMSIRRDIANTVQVVVQLDIIDGKHRVTHIEEISNVVSVTSGNIATTPLFEYDRYKSKHKGVNKPSENLISFLAQRGVNIDSRWFQ